MPLSPDQLAWPGADRQRADAACFHLIRTLQIVALSHDRQRIRTRWMRKTVLRAAGENLRIAHGFLGAIGFEHRARLDL